MEIGLKAHCFNRLSILMDKSYSVFYSWFSESGQGNPPGHKSMSSSMKKEAFKEVSNSNKVFPEDSSEFKQAFFQHQMGQLEKAEKELKAEEKKAEKETAEKAKK